jgi:probable HAF family extracellular repeat protein
MESNVTRKAILLLFLLATAPLALAQGTYTQIDYPGASDTKCLGINNAGDVVGIGWFEVDETGGGFLLIGDTFTTINYENGEVAILTGINDLGKIVGYSGIDTGVDAFAYDLETQKFEKLKYPDSRTFPTSINDAGVVIGTYIEHQQILGSFSFLYSVYSMIAPPGSSTVNAYAVSDTGKIVGVALDASTNDWFSFAYNRGKYEKLKLPNLLGGLVVGISPSGDALVGNYIDSSNKNVGFVYQNGNVTTVYFPGSNSTAPTGINDAGEVVGWFYDIDDNTHGFTWTPPAVAEQR